MNPSAPFIDRPVGTSLLALAISADRQLRLVSSSGVEPAGDRSAGGERLRSRPGANPVTMATTVAARWSGGWATIAGLESLTSQASSGQRRSWRSSTWSAASTPRRATCRPPSTPPSRICRPISRRAAVVPQGGLGVDAGRHPRPDIEKTCRSTPFTTPRIRSSRRGSRGCAASAKCVSAAARSRRSACRSMRRGWPPWARRRRSGRQHHTRANVAADRRDRRRRADVFAGDDGSADGAGGFRRHRGGREKSCGGAARRCGDDRTQCAQSPRGRLVQRPAGNPRHDFQTGERQCRRDRRCG